SPQPCAPTLGQHPRPSRARSYSCRVALEGKRVFITGGAGLIGTTLARELVDRNTVVAFDNLHRDALTGLELADHPNFELIQGDILDPEALHAAAEGATHFVHCAAIAGVDTVLESPVRTMRVNVIGTYHALEAALATQSTLERFIDFSTSEVFGTHAFRVEEGQVSTIGSVGEARWTYAVSKLAGEHMAHAYYDEVGLPTVTVHPFNVYGPGQIGGGAIRAFIEAALAGQDLTIHGDGSQIRAWCYVDDMVEAVLLSLERPAAVGQSFNIGNSRSTVTIYDLAQRIKRLSGCPGAYTFPATANVVGLAGATPVLVDVDPTTNNIDPAQVEVTARTKAIMPVHLFGRPARLEELPDLPLIEDAAGALGARHKGRACGGLGAAGCLSFHPRKIVTTGEGGAVTTDDGELAERVRSARHHGWSPSDRYDDMPRGSTNYRLPDILCAIGIPQVRRLEELLAARER